MKKLIITLSLPIVLFASSCSKFVEGYDSNPNAPEKATPGLVLSGAELGLFAVYGGQQARVATMLVQQTAGTAAQQLQVSRYNIKEGDNTNDWNNVYNNIVQPCNDIILNYGAQNHHYRGIAKVIKAMGLGIATDFWGDVPATEAGMAIFNNNTTPKFDKQQDILTYIQSLLDEGIADMASNEDSVNISRVGTDDFVFGNDGADEDVILANWTSTAWLLKARYANRLSKIDPTGSATTALTDLSHVVAGVNANINYGDGSNEQNQWAAFNDSRGTDLRVGATIVNMLKTNNDPRLPFYVAKDDDGNYTGAIAGSENLAASLTGPYLATSDKDIPMVTSVEASFIKAEASLRGNDKATAATAYNAAVVASVTAVTGAAPSAAFVTAFASETSATITLEKIMTQKYLALYGQIETWADWRRTNFPTLTPYNGGKIPRRLPTVLDERLYNPNAVVISDITQPVYWDGGQ